MKRDDERVRRNMAALIAADLDAFVCALPINVLLLSGYWPVVGTSFAVFTRDGQVLLLVPEDELEIAQNGWADDVVSYSAGSLANLQSTSEMLTDELGKLAAKLSLKMIGFESGAVSVPVSYAAMTLFGWSIQAILSEAFAPAELRPAESELAILRSMLTPDEIVRVRKACKIAEDAFSYVQGELKVGATEIEVASALRERLNPADRHDVTRADGFVFCMSGENAYDASAAFQISRTRRLREHDLVLVHCNSYADGFWTDITRTYCLGDSDQRQRKMYEAVILARDAALDAIAPRMRAKDVDARARDVLTERGFGEAFKHGLGHSVGFTAIDHNAPPRLHPASPDRLEEGMVFNIEPAIYLEGIGGMRHCDMVAVTDNGAELLTPFQNDLESMIISGVDAALS